MNIGLIVYSQTGNTYSVAEKLLQKLAVAGHSATLERIEIVGEPQPGQPVEFTSTPDPTGYDALIFGSPVQAFSLCQAMKEYLQETDSLEGKSVACLVTQAFPYAWMGGNRAIRQMEKLCAAKGANVCGSGVVNWMKKRRDQQIVDVTDNLSQLF